MIKGLVTVSTGSVVNLLVDGELPEVGHYYFLENATEGTAAQNKAFHALCMEYYKSGQHSYNVDNYDDFRNNIKKSLGAGFEGFVYIDIQQDDEFEYHYCMRDAKKLEDIPQEIKDDPNMKDLIRGKLKSWSGYTKKQRKETIDNLISEMMQSGINTPKFQEIMKGMNNDI